MLGVPAAPAGQNVIPAGGVSHAQHPARPLRAWRRLNLAENQLDTGVCEIKAAGPYTFIGFGTIAVTKPYKFIWFGDIDAPKP